MILVDTSAWVEYFRATGSSAAVEVRRLLSEEADQITMCEPIAMEILSGATDDRAQARLEQLVNGLPSLTVDQAVDFRTAASIYRSARRSGQTVRSINDCLIAAVAIRHGVGIVHRDADFDVIAGIAPLAATSFR
ncbi:type II toxin-antitoxin system VapC family toxin [Mycobacterium celatum]|uniref:Ribonuclease VapC n=1 Tax=Mycobacterium celatum TaxID=28045 RepID=A0A1X1RTV7_MYCCE|nr:PIN domain nuclease [Mycobacterium celatum]ORV16617.1 ribonuclease [Mycobacterium celatum]PIB79393.1 PIN domain nuclease [Mycobacterium celatum]